MKSLIKIFNVFLFCWLGELASKLTGGFIPGCVLGMILLFIALSFKIIPENKVDAPARLLADNMGLFFLPAGVGLMTQMDLIRQYWGIILICVIVSSVLVIGSVAYIQDRLERRRKP
ncbi:CidA/LrgA family protein [Porphyromonas pogonae]|uniref:CidA/LrgA family protein n=1 Tax=Porphyromonas pogonae TaxID=867595 RepID=UPI002E77D51B|nr:CidA/LrgA family protein [Porphyromonas pogonae]